MSGFFREHKKEVHASFKEMDNVFHKVGIALGFQKGKR